jgi:glycosyltransferase involved in cell wall biosynthesis
MNIAMVCDPVMYQSGGSDVSTVRFAKLLKKRGHKVIFIAARLDRTKKIDYYDTIKVHCFRSMSLPFLNTKFRIILPTVKSMKRIFVNEHIDVVHVMHPLPSAKSAIKAAKSLNLKIVTHSHARPENVFWMFIPKILRLKKLNDYFYKSVLKVYTKADATICPTKFAEKSLKQYEPKLNTAVITNGVDTKKFCKMNATPLKKKYKINSKDKIILFVGRLHPEKNVATIIKAMPYLLKKDKNVRLLIAGEGYLRSTFVSLAKKLNAAESITFLGNVRNDKIAEVYNIADVFVLPSIIEIEGMVVLEAMACAKPILIANSKHSAAPQFVNGNGYLFETKSPTDFANKAFNILKNPKLKNAMGKKSLALSKSYDINNSVLMLEKVYRE